MRVVVAGGHGKIALRLERMLAARGDVAVGLIRNPGHVRELRNAGAVPAICDLEAARVDDVTAHLAAADAVVFAAGAGPGSGIPRKDTVDRAAAALLADAAERAGVRRYLMISSMGVDAPPSDGRDEVFAAYLRAKRAAEEDLRSRPLRWTILRPGRLTDAPGRRRVRLAPRVERGDVPRDDVAHVLLALLDTATGGETLELVGGETPIPDAVAQLRHHA
ncbi:NAD(P)H-binding [Micromonospora pattaloongensis]|uniref:NAD(P)H-binding n=1 Tax=Micromonospora pattaloongensis TaxID=405436 RepID=A0A1H3TAE5_9ACTN|nr:NAD(P)-binding oxidoreductase [Micromonospora pattaloongensis]SDZ47232.1 NAD(P)H-binding [Micromonospora pattaloongensis]